ncbi:MAG: protein-L-isoaspartate O-methyltransferase [Phenylobacterium sp.]|uniref:protein-L-isoaspartate O-methyltransferase family protein n=1 Tax=Phenylobacterium sp. TaxID=1871053 RepID=UPI00120C7E5D|nr:protein-L-isoaspartate O-methyltransferase [Phenylobacterium sp.]TAJ69486.1 MAG: protein-L-isoaspartate O-methyltransferase [Phenylobacterium sp.]
MADLASARLNMVESQVRTADVTDVRIHDAMRAVRREAFLPEGKAHLAYADIEAEYAPGRWLLKPRDVAKLLQALRPMPGDRALAIGAPYAAAVIEELGVPVVRAEPGGPLPEGRFDIVVCEGGVSRVPEAWLAALATNGRLGVVERDGPVGKACLYVRADDGIGRRDLFDSFPPVLAGFEASHGFAF